MIKQLQKQLQLIILATLGLTLIIVFTVYGFLENSKLVEQNNKILESVLYNLPLEEQSIFGEVNPTTNLHPNTFLAEYLPINQQYIAISTNWSIDSETFQELMSQALNHAESQGTILNESIQFKKDPGSQRTRIAFLDLSSTKQSQKSLIVNLVSLLLLSLFVLIILAYFLSKRLIQPIEQSLTKQKQFIADASHELKNPLTILSNNTTILKAQPQNNNNQWLQSNEIEINRMSQLVHQLLYLAQSDNPETVLEKKLINLSKLVESSILDYEPIFFEQQKQIELTYLESNVNIYANQENIIKLLRILLDNALKYSLTQSTTSIHLNKNILTISNPAHHLDDKQLNQLFDRFYRVEPSRSKEGYGLGLAIAYEIMKQQGGQIKVTSHNNEITFKLIFDNSHTNHKSPSGVLES